MSEDLRHRAEATAVDIEALDRSLELESVRMSSLVVTTAENWDDIDFDDAIADADHEVLVRTPESLAFRITIGVRGFDKSAEDELFSVKVSYDLTYSRSELGFVGQALTSMKLPVRQEIHNELSPIPEGLARRYSQTYGMVIVEQRLRGLLDVLASELRLTVIPYVFWDRAPLRYVEVLNEMTISKRSDSKSRPRKRLAKKTSARRAIAGAGEPGETPEE
jgi:hypothetical protein